MKKKTTRKTKGKGFIGDFLKKTYQFVGNKFFNGNTSGDEIHLPVFTKSGKIEIANF